jgi:hypothetical protein
LLPNLQELLETQILPAAWAIIVNRPHSSHNPVGKPVSPQAFSEWNNLPQCQKILHTPIILNQYFLRKSKKTGSVHLL